jgi:hypothetical protein
MFQRPTSLASAFINAAIPVLKKVDHDVRAGGCDANPRASWVARRVALNCDKPKFGMVTEADKRPTKGVR